MVVRHTELCRTLLQSEVLAAFLTSVFSNFKFSTFSKNKNEY